MTASHGRPPAAAILLVPVVASIVLALFAWPSARLEPRDLPVGVAGPPAAATTIEQRLSARGGAFDVHRYEGEAAARAAIEDREVYGAFVASPRAATLLTASGASGAVAQALSQAAAEVGGERARPAVEVRDIVTAPAAASGLGASVLPLVIAGILAGVVSSLLAGGSRQVGFLLIGAITTGLAATAIVQAWLGVVEGDWAANAGTLSLTVLAIAATVAGLRALMGNAGIALAASIMVFVGNPFSGVATAPELLPRLAGDLGQALPPGAGGNLLRSTGFFDGAGASGHVAVLAAWTAAGLAAIAFAALRARRAATPPAPAAT